MKSLADAIHFSPLISLPRSARGLASRVGMTGEISLRNLIDSLEVIFVEKDVVTPAGFPLNGKVSFTLTGKGAYKFRGHMRATGLPSYKYSLQAFVQGQNGLVVAAHNSGEVHGTLSSGPRQVEWEDPPQGGSVEDHLILRENWPAFRSGATLGYNLDAHISGPIGDAWSVLKVLGFGLVAGSVLGPTGMAIVIGKGLADAIGITPAPNQLAGVAVAGGMILVFGPGVIVPAVVAGVAVGSAVFSDIQFRKLTDSEKEKRFAESIFHDKLPLDRILITNLTHGGGRRYTIPSIDGYTILVNMGSGQSYTDPVDFADSGTGYSQPGSVFAHELTHAWQIANTKFLPGLLCKAHRGEDQYDYHAGTAEADRRTDLSWVNRPWSSFTLEQQAHIVDDWYGDHYADLGGVAAVNDPAFHFIANNIRRGVD